MDIKEFRKIVLKKYYELSKGDSLYSVNCDKVTKSLIIKFEDLFPIIKYLDDKGFLKMQSYESTKITTKGIDEVENNFPIMGPISNDLEKDTQLVELINEIDEKIELCNQGLLKKDEWHEILKKIDNFLKQYLDKCSLPERKFNKMKTETLWTIELPGGYINPEQVDILIKWKKFLIEILKDKGVEDYKRQIFIQKGEYYTARDYIRKILEKANIKIDIQDNYIDIEIFHLLLPYLENNPSLKIRILTKQYKPSFKSDLVKFSKQFGNIEVKSNNDCHDRFIIIDGNEVYHSGYSLKDLGSSASLISLVDDLVEKSKVINSFENWWSKGSSI